MIKVTDAGGYFVCKLGGWGSGVDCIGEGADKKMKTFEERILQDDEDEIWKKLDNKTKDALLEFAAEKTYLTIYMLSGCESPIEWLLGVYLDELSYGVFIETQWEVKTKIGVFRADFLLSDGMPPFDGTEKQLLIECDGHDYHEKTKEQAARDKRRDRALKLAGYEVIHFTGSEIWANPGKCAREALDHLKALAKR